MIGRREPENALHHDAGRGVQFTREHDEPVDLMEALLLSLDVGVFVLVLYWAAKFDMKDAVSGLFAFRDPDATRASGDKGAKR